MRTLACDAAPFCKALVCCCCFSLPRQQPQLIVEVPTPNQPARRQNVVGQLGDVLEKMTSAPRFLAILAFTGHRSRVSFSFSTKPLNSARTELPGGRAQCVVGSVMCVPFVVAYIHVGRVLKATAVKPAWGGLVSESVVRVKNTLNKQH